MSDESYIIEVIVVDKETNKGLSGHKVKEYNGNAVETNNKGKATIVADTSWVYISLDGSKIYEGYASDAAKPIICKV